ncbi:DUF3080 family protein [Pseudoalteromonas maricaloris]|uniref:DUF3080 family protein n=1 Tax=Pseudoalteromonas maricaloris TaxID=184924 RepID=UPI003C1EF96D
MRLVKRIASTLILFTLAGCSKQPSDIAVEYQQRLASATDIEVVHTAPLYNPEVQKVPLPTSELTISMLDIATAGHCKVTNLIAAHNNQLGKVSYPSERLKYNILFIQQAPHCIQHPNTSDELQQTLTQAVQEKKQQLPRYFLHMMTFERELASLSLLIAEEVPLELPAAHSNMLEAVNELAELVINMDTPENLSPTTLTPAIKVLSQRFISSLVTSVRKQTQLNNATTSQLQQLRLRDDICKSGGNKKQAKIINNIFNKYYLSVLQPYQAMLSLSMEELISAWQPIHLLYQNNNLADPLTLQQHLDNLKDSAKTHVKWWQKFYELCEIPPV